MQSGFTDIFSSEKSGRSIQYGEVLFISSMHGLRCEREVIEPIGHLVEPLPE